MIKSPTIPHRTTRQLYPRPWLSAYAMLARDGASKKRIVVPSEALDRGVQYRRDALSGLKFKAVDVETEKHANPRAGEGATSTERACATAISRTFTRVRETSPGEADESPGGDCEEQDDEDRISFSHDVLSAEDRASRAYAEAAFIADVLAALAPTVFAAFERARSPVLPGGPRGALGSCAVTSEQRTERGIAAFGQTIAQRLDLGRVSAQPVQQQDSGLAPMRFKADPHCRLLLSLKWCASRAESPVDETQTARDDSISPARPKLAHDLAR
jgi:hypothetical protein